MSNSHGVSGEALQVHAAYKKYYKSHEQVVRCVWMCKEIEGSSESGIIIITIVPSYTINK